MPRNPRNPRFIKHADFNMRYLLRIMSGKTVVCLDYENDTRIYGPQLPKKPIK